MVLRCIAEPVKDEFFAIGIKRMKDFEDLRGIHRSLMGHKDPKTGRTKTPSKEAYEAYKQILRQGETNWNDFLMKIQFEVETCAPPHASLLTELWGLEPEGGVDCIDWDIKTDFYRYIKRRAPQHVERGEWTREMADHALEVAETMRYRVPNCTEMGYPSKAWLHRNFPERSWDELVRRGGILQLP